VKRRTFKQLRKLAQSEDHHNVYVVLLDPAVAKIRKARAENPDRDPTKPCVYVGMTGLTPDERFANHKAGIKAASVVTRYGITVNTQGGVKLALASKIRQKCVLRRSEACDGQLVQSDCSNISGCENAITDQAVRLGLKRAICVTLQISNGDSEN